MMMTGSRTIPPSRWGNAYRALLMIAGVVAIIGLADAARALFWLTLNQVGGSREPWMEYALPGLRLVAWGLVAGVAYVGWRRRMVAPTWAIVCIPLVAWALLLLQRYG
jgi:hypothetical protein